MHYVHLTFTKSNWTHLVRQFASVFIGNIIFWIINQVMLSKGCWKQNPDPGATLRCQRVWGAFTSPVASIFRSANSAANLDTIRMTPKQNLARKRIQSRKVSRDQESTDHFRPTNNENTPVPTRTCQPFIISFILIVMVTLFTKASAFASTVDDLYSAAAILRLANSNPQMRQIAFRRYQFMSWYTSSTGQYPLEENEETNNSLFFPLGKSDRAYVLLLGGDASHSISYSISCFQRRRYR